MNKENFKEYVLEQFRKVYSRPGHIMFMRTFSQVCGISTSENWVY